VREGKRKREQSYSKARSERERKKDHPFRVESEMGSSDIDVNSIPEYSRPIVRAMKEIVNCSEQEIYAMLVECNMNADEAITRLLSQGFFNKVSAFFFWVL